jgi:hypothetical protein
MTRGALAAVARAALVGAAALLLAGCDLYRGYGTPNMAVYPNGGAAHTPPPAVNLPPADYPPPPTGG